MIRWEYSALAATLLGCALLSSSQKSHPGGFVILKSNPLISQEIESWINNGDATCSLKFYAHGEKINEILLKHCPKWGAPAPITKDL